MAAVFLLVSAGCQDRTIGTVAGTITLDGKPLPDGSLVFAPTRVGAGRTNGGVISGGRYELTSSVGVMRVAINSTAYVEPVNGKEAVDPENPLAGPYRERVPARYNEKSELTVTVEPGMNEANFDLHSDAGKR
jgi:hypothetical protein